VTSLIEIEQLEITCIVGIYPHEREQEQTLLVDLRMEHDFADAARTQEIARTVNYAEVAQTLTSWVREQRALLLENLAVGACELVLERWSGVNAVRIKVMKPAAIETAKHAAVTFELRR
jgi:dihydroneopterin aldolase